MQRDYNHFDYHIFKKKKLTLTSFYSLSQDTWFYDSLKLYINQSRIYNFFEVGKVKNV